MKYIKLLLIPFLFFSCSNSTDNADSQSSKVEYTIEDKKLSKPIKAQINVQLKEKISSSQIEQIANEIINNNTGYNRYFINYYLPEMKIGNVAWATSHKESNIDVKIIGATKEEENVIKSIQPTDVESLGKWYEESNIPCAYIIYSSDDSHFLQRAYKDGSHSSKELTLEGEKFYLSKEDDEYFKIESNGNLGHYSDGSQFLEVRPF